MALRRKKHNSRTRFKLIEHNGFYPYFSRYLEISAVQGIAQETIRRRDSSLRRFIEWCDERGLDDPKAITKPILERYQRYLYHYRKDNGDPLSVGSQNSILTPIKTFFKWLAQENYLLYNPASELIIPKKPKALPRHVLSVEDVAIILEQPDTDTLEGIRDRAMLEVLYATGIRRKELINLCEHDIDSHRQTLLVREGKNNRDRYLPLGDRALQWVIKYQQEVRDHLLLDHREQRLFLTSYGEPFSLSNVGAYVKVYIEEAGINVGGACHLFRHAMATHMLENGADIRFIQAMLGHIQLSTTEIYTRVSVEKLREIHRATHPAMLEPPTTSES